MTALETEGRIERHVGRGTFLREPAVEETNYEPLVRRLADVTSPHAAMMARLSLEPELAGQAAIHAAPRHLAEARSLAKSMREATNWAEYEKLDARLHELIAEASGNPLLAEFAPNCECSPGFGCMVQPRAPTRWATGRLPLFRGA